MKSFFVSQEAYEDLWGIWQYLAQEAGVMVADRIEEDLFDAFDTLAQNPGIGHSRTDLTKAPVFFFSVRQYLVIYRKKVPLEIAAVIHGKRNARRVLKERL